VLDGGADALIQICDEQRQRTRAPSCSHKICATCLRDYLQIMLRKIAQSTLLSTSASASAAASSLPPTAAASSSLTEADLLCPAAGCPSQLQQ
jgi:hypothetical protein